MAVAQFPTTGGIAPCTPDVHRIWDGDIRAIKGGRSAVYLFFIYLYYFLGTQCPHVPEMVQCVFYPVWMGTLTNHGAVPLSSVRSGEAQDGAFVGGTRYSR